MSYEWSIRGIKRFFFFLFRKRTCRIYQGYSQPVGKSDGLDQSSNLTLFTAGNLAYRWKEGPPAAVAHGGHGDYCLNTCSHGNSAMTTRQINSVFRSPVCSFTLFSSHKCSVGTLEMLCTWFIGIHSNISIHSPSSVLHFSSLRHAERPIQNASWTPAVSHWRNTTKARKKAKMYEIEKIVHHYVIIIDSV